jgi:hypothetical protein
MGDSATVIDRVEVFGYDLSYVHGDYVMSSGRVASRLPSTVVRISTQGGSRVRGGLPAREHVSSGLRRGRPGGPAGACAGPPRS